MPTNPPILLLDTNIWLDLFLPGRRRQEEVRRLIKVAQATGAALAFPSQSSLDVFQRVRIENKRWVRQSGALSDAWAAAIRDQAWDCVTAMQNLATAVPVDSSDIYLACKYRDAHGDYEDDLVMAACGRAKANYLVTSDEQLLAHAPVDGRTPAQMTELLLSGQAKGHPTSSDNDSTAWLYRWLCQE